MHRDFAGETMHRARIMVTTRMLMPIGCGPTRYVILPYCKAQFAHAGARSAPGNPKKFCSISCYFSILQVHRDTEDRKEGLDSSGTATVLRTALRHFVI